NGAISVAALNGSHDLSLTSGSGAIALGDLGAVTRLGAVSADGAATLTGGTYNADSIALGATTLTGNTSLNATDTVTLASVGGAGHALTATAAAANLGDVSGVSTLTARGPVTLTGTSYAANNILLGATTLTGDTSLNATAGVTLASVDGVGNDLTANAQTTSLGNVSGVGALVATGNVTLTGASYAADSIALGATTLDRDTSIDATGALTLASVDGGGPYVARLDPATGLVSVVSSGVNHALTASAASTSLGDVSNVSALAVTGSATLTGDTYKAGGFAFGGDVTLTAATTTIDSTRSATAAGDITFGGAIFGTTDGGQSLTLTAGPGTGAKSANGDISLNNAGVTGTRLGTLDVSGDDFTALTVDLAGDFDSKLTGNQVFAADTLNAAGDVNTQAGGNVSGHIVAGGDVTLTTPGTVSGVISGDSLVLNSGSVSNATLTGNNVTATVAGSFDAAVNATNSATIAANTITGTFTGNTVSLSGQTVNGQVTANTLNVASQQGGAITGTFTPGTVSDGLSLNGQIVGSNGSGNTGDTGNGGGTGNGGTGNSGTTTNNFPNVNAQQLVVEGFALPTGTQVAANGQLILPPGTVIGLLSPGGGTPRVTMVQTVQELGELLDQGYSAIVIDLKGRKKAVKLASN
ncbi:MAG TPA: hypothetical protein VGC16_10735, partial [Rhizomicrobium sp.]